MDFLTQALSDPATAITYLLAFFGTVSVTLKAIMKFTQMTPGKADDMLADRYISKGMKITAWLIKLLNMLAFNPNANEAAAPKPTK